MNKKYLTVYCFILLATSSAGQSKILEWEEITNAFSNIPNEINVFKASGKINNDTITAYYAISNIQSGKLVFFPIYSPLNQKPEKYYEENKDDVILITNGGYFGTNVSYSLLLNNYITHVPNIKALSRVYNNTNQLYYPTRAAFGIDSKLHAEAAYVYTFNSNQTWKYPIPSPNTLDELPQPQPTSKFPEGGSMWAVSEAIGGGPLLIKDSVINLNYAPELFPADITGSIAPRTAIGVTGKGEIINLVVDGRQPHSRGVSLQSLAEILLELGCIEAINLDGGGSSVIMAGDRIINKPSDGNSRSIPTIVAIKKAQVVQNNDTAHMKYSQVPVDSLPSGNFGNTKTLLFGTGEICKYYFNDILPGKYRIELFQNTQGIKPATSVLLSIISHGLNDADTILVNQQDQKENHFLSLGSWHLGNQDSLVLINQTNEYARLDVMRLVRTGSSVPSIEMDPKISFGTHSVNERIMFTIHAQSKNSSRKIKEFKVYEIINNDYTKIVHKQFEPSTSYSDSVAYSIIKDANQIRILAAVYDELNDSSFVTYTILIDNTPPTIALGKNSVLEGRPGDTLIFELKVHPANESRPLSELSIFKNPDSVNELLLSLSPDPLGDTLIFQYEILSEDIPYTQFRFIIRDQAGYFSNRDFSYFHNYLSIPEPEKIFVNYDPNGKSLHIRLNERTLEAATTIFIYDLSGKQVVVKEYYGQKNISLNITNLSEGYYVVRILEGNNFVNYRFFHPK